MAIGVRTKHAAVMCCIWFIVMMPLAIYILRGASTEEIFVIFIMIIISGMFQFLGASVYSGDYRGLAGFSHMTDAHIAEYESKHDMVAMCKFLGISLMVSSYLFFFTYILSREYIGGLWGMILAIVLTVVMLIAISICSSDERFSTDRNTRDDE